MPISINKLPNVINKIYKTFSPKKRVVRLSDGLNSRPALRPISNSARHSLNNVPEEGHIQPLHNL
jgi:hypothetical protein